MSLFPLDVLLAGLDIVDELTEGVQTSAQIIRFMGQTSNSRTYAEPVAVDVIEDLTQRVITKEGRAIGVSGTLLIMSEVEGLGLSGLNPPRQEPIDPRDLVIISNGQQRGIAHVDSGITNPETVAGILVTVYLS
jgi:hypothetical protein